MTTTYDPKHADYLDEANVRDELTRVYDICSGCRLCVGLCTSFPTLFEMIDRHDDAEAGRLTPAQQDQVVDECFQCKRCYLNCPYVPGVHEAAVDFPRLMLRADAMRHDTKQTSVRSRRTTGVMGHTDLVGRLASATAPLANRLVTAQPGSFVRKVVEKATGVSSVRLLSPYARQRFTTWFEKRPRVRITKRQARVAVFPTCLVEYQNPAVGQALVKVYERNGIECSVPDGVGCCGAPYLHSGDIEKFQKVAKRNVHELAAWVRRGRDVVVPQPTCGYVLKHDYVDHVGGADAVLVASNTFDAAEYLMKLHKSDGSALDTDFTGDVPSTVTYHTPCHLHAQNIGLKGRDLIKLTGARVTLVRECSGVDGMWGLRAENEHIAIPIAERLGAHVTRAAGDVVVGDCHLANTAIAEQTGRRPLHPLELIARAYGLIPEEER
jgi:Fe-S oxidoreductase